VAANPTDFETVSTLAQYEAVYGLRSKAIELRQRLVQLDAANRGNLGELYGLLLLPADFGSVRNPDGSPRFDARGWAAVPADEQRRLLADAEITNAALAERVYAASMEVAPYDIRFAGRKAAAMRERGKFDVAAKALNDVIARAEKDGKATAAMYTEQGLYLDAVGERAASDAALAKAVSLQDPKKHEVDLVLVELEARRGNTKRAIEVLSGALGDPPTVANLIRLADLQTVAQQFDDAQKTIERVRPMLGKSPSVESQRQVEMLVAGIAAGQADQFHAAGKAEESKKKTEEALAALGRAEALAPSDLFAPLRRVQILRGMSVAQQDPARLDAAIGAADRALARNAMYWPMVSARADLSLDKRDIKAAIGLVERFLQAQPASDEARMRLMDMQMASGNAPRAIEVARGGIEQHPQDSIWAERLGQLLEASGDVAGAAREYERAFTLDPRSMSYLEKATNARLASGGAAEALSLLRGANELTARSPVLRALAAVAISRSGKREEGVVAGREALTTARASKDDPALNTERTLMVLRNLFAADKPADFEAFVLQTGTPTAVECAIIADTWARSGPTGKAKALEWCGKVDAFGDAASAGVRAGVALTRGTVLYASGDVAGACDAFVQAATLSPRNAAALNNAAYLLVKSKNDTAKAFEYATQAVTLAPAQADYLDTLGYVLLKMGRMADADDVLGKSVAVSPTASGLLHLAQVKAAQGNVGDARQLLDRARARPGDDDSKKSIEEFAETLKGK
jgi:tetratricopeptide (TPR) repeat protein